MSAAEFDAPSRVTHVTSETLAFRYSPAVHSNPYETVPFRMPLPEDSMNAAAGNGPALVWLDDPRATDVTVAGAKAAALARAAASRLPVLEGFVLTTTGRADDEMVADAWRSLSANGSRPLVVRSSSVAEDGDAQSMAGLFTSVLDVRGIDDFHRAVDEVLASRTRSGLIDAPMAVLVQPFLVAAWGGVLFTADPIGGRTDRMVVTVVDGGVDAVVGGEASGWTAALTRRGRVAEVHSDDGPRPPAAVRRRLARLARRAEKVFGGPQDIEWAAAADGRVVLLQSRLITTLHGPVTGPVLGAGPVAETFPEPLSPLEEDLWIPPLRDGLRAALELTAAAPSSRITRSPIATTVGGVAVVDLELLGATPRRGGLLRRLDPRPPARRLRAAWRVGRVTAALPALARDIVEQVDADLAAVPKLNGLSNRTLVGLLRNGRRFLVTLHGYEALAGMLAHDRLGTPTAASMALSALAQARADGIDSDELIEHQPVVLALVPPRVGPTPALPDMPTTSTDPNPVVDEFAISREALRLRARWVQELTARAAWELGRRLESVGVIDSQEAVRLLTLDELSAVVDRRTSPEVLPRTVPSRPVTLPTAFRLAADGTPMAVAAATTGAATGAGGGTGRGPVHVGGDPPDGAVLVVRHLDPRLAPFIPRLAGLVAETGSPLSHLAILAREHGVPTVVGYASATERFAPGELVEVDGATGEATVVAEDALALSGGHE
jgi:rifampicin phosphotransferase